MDLLSKVIQNNTKPKLMAITCLATLVAPHLFSLVKNSIADLFDKEKQKHALYVGIELGGTNYNVAIGKPISDSKG